MSLPSNLQFFLNRLSGYARNTYRVSSVNNDTAVAGGFVTVDLPSQALLRPPAHRARRTPAPFPGILRASSIP
jgi:hypothetical protein